MAAPEIPAVAPDLNLGYLLAQSAHEWRLGLAHVLQPHGLTPPQFFMLMSVYRQQARHNELPTQKQAAAHTAMDLNVASQVTRKLVMRRLLERHVHPEDARAYVLSLTPTGLALAKASSSDARAWNDMFFAPARQLPLGPALQLLVKES